MTSRTETVLKAVVAALAAKAAEPDSPLASPRRNDSLFSRMVQDAAGLAKYLNVWDGEEVANEMARA